MTRKELKSLIKEIALKEDKNKLRNDAIQKIDDIFDNLIDALANEDLKVSESSFETLINNARTYLDKSFTFLNKIN